MANAVATFIDRRRKVIATFKSLGATSSRFHGASGAGDADCRPRRSDRARRSGCSAVLLRFACRCAADPGRAQRRPASLLIAVAYGFLVALLFTLWPLGRAELVRAAVLFRDEVAPEARVAALARHRADRRRGAALLGLRSPHRNPSASRSTSASSVAGIFAVFIAPRHRRHGAARRLPRPRHAELALALGSIGAPGGLTRSVMLSLGTGLSLLVAVALANASIVSELIEPAAEELARLFHPRHSAAELPSLIDLVRREAPAAHINRRRCCADAWSGSTTGRWIRSRRRRRRHGC